MKNVKVLVVFMLSLLTFFALGGGGVSAQVVETTDAHSIRQVSALTTSDAAIYSNPSGAFEPMPSTLLSMDLASDSLLIISFSARGTVQPSGSQIIPILFIKCEIDGLPCQPDFNAVEFLYPQFCCDTRSFTWVVHEAKKGAHNIAIFWGMGNPTSAIVSNRTLVVEAAKR